MKIIKHLTAAAFLVIPFAAQAQAQAFPNKPVKILVGYAAGSSTDIAGRLVGQALSEMWKQPVVVENRGGAAGNLAADAVAKSAGDGYTLLFAQNGLAISTASNPKLPFNGEKDLIPVAAVSATPHILIVPNSSPAKSVQELIDMAKKSKAALNFGSSGIGNSDHMAAELFKVVAGIGGVHIPYRGGSLAATDTISGQLDFYFAGMPVGLPQAQAGRVRALAVTGKERFAAAPDVKTVAEQGLPKFEHMLWQGFFMPKSTPPELVKKISDDVLKVLSSKEFRDNLATKGISTFALASGPFQSYYLADVEKWRGVVKASGIVLE
jgi:tripartite-type tricarboxylate transporter receptor subunit TctC